MDYKTYSINVHLHAPSPYATLTQKDRFSSKTSLSIIYSKSAISVQHETFIICISNIPAPSMTSPVAGSTF